MASNMVWRNYQRREFLRDAAAASALAMIPRLSGGQSFLPKNSRVFVTSDTKKHEELPAPSWTTQQPSSSSETVQIEASQQFQPMLGFGCAYTDAACFLLSGMQPSARQTFLEDTFSPRKMNLNVGRTSIGASDYSRDLYNYDDVPDDIEMKHFSIAHDEAYILPMLREMRRLNPELFLLSTPWSPPGWMKTYGSMLGGWMTKQVSGTLCHLLRNAFSMPIARLAFRSMPSPHRTSLRPTRAAACLQLTGRRRLNLISFVITLAPCSRRTTIKLRFGFWTHNYNLWKRVRWQMQDAELRKYVSGVAWHGYVGTPDMMSRLHDTLPDLPFYWTERWP